jgi:hypothetical protein
MTYLQRFDRQDFRKGQKDEAAMLLMCNMDDDGAGLTGMQNFAMRPARQHKQKTQPLKKSRQRRPRDWNAPIAAHRSQLASHSV